MGQCCTKPEVEGPEIKVATTTGPNTTDSIPPVSPLCVVSVGIDFGTARSGYAYSIGDSLQVNLQYSWPGEKVEQPKTLTALLYDRATWRPIAWGMEAHNRYQCVRPDQATNYAYIEGFKLMLSDDPTDVENMAHAPPKDFPHDAPTTIGHFLEFLKEHLEEKLRGTLGVKWRNTHTVKYCLTVPAGWGEEAKYRMRQAAVQAGLIARHDSPDLQLVYEPEAAALTACKANTITVQAGQVMLIVDAGGGTVDFTMHEVEEQNGGKMLSEATYRECLVKGSKFLDRQFEDAVADLFGLDLFVEWCRKYPSDYLELLSVWEGHKKDFVGDSGANIRLPTSLADMTPPALQKRLAATGGYRDRLARSVNQMQEIFDLAVGETLTTVEQMVQRAGRQPNYLLLVGGLGSSKYLQRRLRERFGSRMGEPIIPDFGYAAVVNGAVLQLRQPEAIKKRISNLTYGFRAFQPWQKGWPEHIRYKNTHETDKGFKVAIKKGDEVTDGMEFKHIVAPSDDAAKQGLVRVDLLVSKAVDPGYIDPGYKVVKIAESIVLPVDMRLVSTPDQYKIQLTFKFKAAEIEVVAYDTVKREFVSATIDFAARRTGGAVLG